MTKQELFEELENITGAKAKIIKKMLHQGYLLKEIYKKIGKFQLPSNLVAHLNTMQEKRLKRCKFSYKHSLNDVKTCLRHLLNARPNDAKIEEQLSKIRVPFSFLKHMVNEKKIIDFSMDIANIETDVIDVSFMFANGSDPKGIFEAVEPVMQGLPN